MKITMVPTCLSDRVASVKRWPTRHSTRERGSQKKRWDDNIREWTCLEFCQRAAEDRLRWLKIFTDVYSESSKNQRIKSNVASNRQIMSSASSGDRSDEEPSRLHLIKEKWIAQSEPTRVYISKTRGGWMQTT